MRFELLLVVWMQSRSPQIRSRHSFWSLASILQQQWQPCLAWMQTCSMLQSAEAH